MAENDKAPTVTGEGVLNGERSIAAVTSRGEVGGGEAIAEVKGITEFQLGEDRVGCNGGKDGEPGAGGLCTFENAGFGVAGRGIDEVGIEGCFPGRKAPLSELKALGGGRDDVVSEFKRRWAVRGTWDEAVDDIATDVLTCLVTMRVGRGWIVETQA